jgi:hypothetical protein
MADKQQAISYLTDLKRDMLARREQLRRPLAQLELEIEHVSATLALALRENKPDNSSSELPDFPIAKLRGLSQRQAVIAIAQYSGGTLKAQTAKQILLRAGLMKNTKNATNMTHNAFVQSGKFERIGKGEFRLKTFLAPRPITAKPDDPTVMGLFPSARPV